MVVDIEAVSIVVAVATGKRSHARSMKFELGLARTRLDTNIGIDLYTDTFTHDAFLL